MRVQISLVDTVTKQKWSSAACHHPLGKFQRQRGLVEKERGHLFKSYIILEEWQASVLESIPFRTSRENPATLCQTNPRLSPEFLLPFKNTILWETSGSHLVVLQAAQLLSSLVSSLRLLSGDCVSGQCCPSLLPPPLPMLGGSPGPAAWPHGF